MIRSQIYLSEQQRVRLSELAAQKGENVSELIREAIDQYFMCEEKTGQSRKDLRKRIFKKTFGMWKDNSADFKAIRESADRV